MQLKVGFRCCKHYEGGLCWECQRMANYADLSFSDEEVLTIFLFGVIDKKKEIKDTVAASYRAY